MGTDFSRIPNNLLSSNTVILTRLARSFEQQKYMFYGKDLKPECGIMSQLASLLYGHVTALGPHIILAFLLAANVHDDEVDYHVLS